MTLRTRVAATGAAALTVIAVSAATAASGVGGPVGPGFVFVLVSLFTGLTFGLAGLLLLALRPGNVLGPLLAVAGTALTLEFALREYAYRGLPGAATAGWAGLLLDPLFFPVPIALVLLLFPDGRLPSPRWRPVVALGVALTGLSVLGSAVRPGPIRDESYDYHIAWRGLLPASSADQVAGLLQVLTSVGLLVLLAVVGGLLVRFARAGADERQPLKPLTVAGTAAVLFLLAQLVPGLKTIGVAGFVVAVAVGIPVALAVGALRYRVWDLDEVLIGAIVYGTLTALITAVYVGAVVALGTLAGTRSTTPDLLPSIVATAVVAVLFAPVKERVGRAARRLVLGVRATPYEALVALPNQLADAPDPAQVLPRIATALTLGLGVPAARARAMDGGTGTGTGTASVAWSPSAPTEPPGDLVVVPVRHLGAVVGDVAVRPSADRPLSSADRRLLADLAAQAGPALRGVSLTGQLEARLHELTARSVELRDSRQRIVSAQARERRRLERDIHDGVQQHMVALAMSIEQTDRVLTGAAGDARMFLVQCREHLDRCIGDLRELVRGIYPPVLATRGLAAALRARARLGAGEVRVTVGDGVDGVRFGEEVELAAYFACLEALQNAAKHAPGSRVVVALDVDGASLCFEVRDDGPGFDPDAVAGGTGLVGLADRVGAAGGELTVTSTPGAGTAVRGRLPLLLPLPLPLPLP